MTNRLKIVLVATAILFVSFALRMELLSVLSFVAIYFAMGSTPEEERAEERARRAADIAHKHAETYQVELAKALARKEAELMGLRPEDEHLKYAKPKYKTSKSNASNDRSIH
jgi:hypothetical protein